MRVRGFETFPSPLDYTAPRGKLIDRATSFNPRADFDRHGGVNISDFGLLAVNFGKQSLIEVP
jgi:hypothetical protein